jgi:type IX secretion system substrate protein
MKNKIILILLIFLSLFVFAQNQNLSNGNVFDGEPYIAINPYNSQHLVVAWMGWVSFSNQFKIKTKTSFDGGQTWSFAVELPHTVSGYSSADPSIDFNQNGDVFTCYIDFTGTTPPVTGGVYICKSTDGGLSWNAPTEVINTNYDGTKWPIDRPWMVIDRSLGIYQGNIYVTTMNLNRTNPTYHPYLSVSNDTGNTFSTSYVDTTGWLAGSLNPLPMCSPAISSTGVFYGAYPSYELSQSLFLQSFMAISNNGGANFTYNNIITYTSPTNVSNYPSAKKANLLLCNPSNSNHLAYLFLSATNGDLDVFLIETTNSGTTWTSPIRINDDPIGNNRMQDLIWGDFDIDGDLIVSWRDRRNGTDSTFQTQSEIWASFRSKDSLQFSPNFQITNQTVAYDSVLESAGNDFMCIKLQNDTLNAVWGDTRDGKLNIWFQNMAVDGTILSVKQISSEEIPEVFIYPNPTTSIINIENENLKRVTVYDMSGHQIIEKWDNTQKNGIAIDLINHSKGTYLVEVITSKGIVKQKIIKQ